MWDIIEPYVSEIFLIVVIAIGGYVVNYYRSRKKIVKDLQKEKDDLKEDVQLIKKTILILAKRIDKQTMEAHDVDTEFYCLTKDLLTDEILFQDKSAI